MAGVRGIEVVRLKIAVGNRQTLPNSNHKRAFCCILDVVHQPIVRVDLAGCVGYHPISDNCRVC